MSKDAKTQEKLKKAAGSLKEMLDTIGPYLPAGGVSEQEQRRNWRLNDGNTTTHKERREVTDLI